jgi:hypothetical protein
MKKIIPFILFIPLFFFSIYFGYRQYVNNKTNKGANTITNKNANSSPNSAITSVPSPTLALLPAPTLAVMSQINLIITSPESGSTVDGTSITVSGTTKPKIDVVVNDQELLSGADGSFNTSVTLDEGENYISIVAYDEDGNVAEREILIMRTMSEE